MEETPRFSLLSKLTEYKQEVVMNQTQQDATRKCSVLRRKINKRWGGEAFVMYTVGYRVKSAACVQAEEMPLVRGFVSSESVPSAFSRTTPATPAPGLIGVLHAWTVCILI